MNDLFSSQINCARKAVNDFRSHLDNRAGGIENEVGYVVIEGPNNLVSLNASLVFDQIDSTLMNRRFVCFW